MPRASLKMRPDGRYRVKYKEKYFYGYTQSEAYAARDEYKRMLERGLREEQLGISVKAYAAKWVATHKAHVSNNMYDTHVRILNRFCDLYGEKRMMDITPTDIQAFYNQYASMSQKTINAHRDTIKGMFKTALGDRVITFDPCLGANPPKGTKGSHRAISAQERTLIRSTKHRIRAGAMAMLFAGLRRGEAMALNIDRDVDFDKCLIHVREAVRFEKGHPLVCDPKTEAGVRSIPMLDVLADELRGKHGLLMQSVDGGLMSESAFDRAWQSYITALETELNGCHKRWYGKTKEHKAILEAGGELPPWKPVNIRPHDLRHSFCTLLYETGVDLKTAMKWMGHSDHEMIMRIYAHLSEEQEKAAYKNLIAGVNKALGVKTGVKKEDDDCKAQ